MNYLLHISIMFEIYLILSLSMNLLAGYSGLLSMSQAAFYGIGSYTTALMLTESSASFSVSIMCAIIINLVTCIPVIYFSIRLRDLYFALATLAWQIIVFSILYNWDAVTNGSFGISGIPKPEIFGVKFSSLSLFASLSGVISLLVLLLFLWLSHSPLSRLFQAVRDDQLTLMSFGKKPSYYKAVAILLSSGVSAIAGSLYATYFSYIDPKSFTIEESILIISIVLIGGLGSIKGSIAGALFYVLLPEVLRYINIPGTTIANVRMMIYALVLILVVLYRPYGFFGKYKFQ